MNSKFLYHEACPACGSKDNRAVFDDGHTYCFGCGDITGSTLNLHQVMSSSPISEGWKKEYPYDANDNIPSKALIWLFSCGISQEQITDHGIQWSPKQELVCWKIGTIGWQGRCFSPTAKTKYISHGKIHEEPTIIGRSWTPITPTHKPDTTIVLVEDYLSAIRVSQFLPCIPLFGCTCSLNTLEQLSKRFSSIKVWLDADKLDNARKIAQNATMLGLTSQVIYTIKDPKNHDESTLKETLNIS